MQINWQEDFIYSVKRHQKLLEKYKNYFNTIFKNEVLDFCYAMTTKKDDRFMYVGSIPRNTEIYLEAEAYKDSPFMTSYDSIVPGSVFAWPDFNQDITNNNSFRHKAEQETGARDLFTLVEKKQNHHHLIGWFFKKPAKEMSMTEEQIIIMKDCVENSRLLQTCLEQFYAEFTPILNKEDLLRTDIKELKGKDYNEQPFIITPHQDNFDENSFMEELDREIELTD